MFVSISELTLTNPITLFKANREKVSREEEEEEEEEEEAKPDQACPCKRRFDIESLLNLPSQLNLSLFSIPFFVFGHPQLTFHLFITR